MTDFYPLGRITPPSDPLDALFPAELHLMTIGDPTQPLPIKSKSWDGPRARINQGNLGACVGFTGENWMGTVPIQCRVSNDDAIRLYRACKQIDGIPNEEGTYDRALAKVLVARGQISRYLWAQGIDDFLQWLSNVGPVMVGTNWYSGMFNPDTGAMLHLTGSVAGGHEYLIRRLDLKNHRAVIRNSWGPDWGLNGEAWIDLDDLWRLVFQEGGDALCAVETRRAHA